MKAGKRRVFLSPLTAPQDPAAVGHSQSVAVAQDLENVFSVKFQLVLSVASWMPCAYEHCR